MKISVQALQPLGRALMLPIAVLPIAGLLLRLGQPDLLDIPFVAAAGSAVFDNLGLLFAVGIAVGFARDGNGAAGLAGIVCFLVATHGAATLLTVPPGTGAGLPADALALATDAFRTKAIDKISVPIGILSGIIAGSAYNRWSGIRLPDYLSFFGGRRFVPIVSGVAGLGLAAVIGFAYSAIATGMDALSGGIIHSGVFGLFLYGVLNRLLIVTGLHHILNNVAWFIVGDFHGSTGDLNRFFAGDPSAGAFMTGFFPVMMFGLPAACLAMYRAALPERRKAVGGMLLSMALTAFLTGVTEPIEFSFMFLAPVLYGLHTLMTGLAMVVMDLLGVKLGFTFSAGLLDYALNFSKATRPLLLVPVGLVYFALYYGVFRWAITRFDIKTPGREPEIAPAAGDDGEGAPVERGAAFVVALGGAGNLASIDACTTRLRLVIRDQAKVDEARLRSLGAKGFVRPSAEALQVVLGPIADMVADEMRRMTGSAVVAVSVAVVPSVDLPVADAAPWIAALGGRGNILSVAANPSRLMLHLADPSLMQQDMLRALGLRAAVVPGDGVVHLLTDEAEPLGRALAA
ncbi:N-acetylglucosamine-specific PTS transporter subunit IIBC [Sphingomonas abietis]|uniref:N-acetylglucosamine-specific PTS transporter subunit IIBC n=1 Tax=Sphingomonas abietis TaxID=3012344 RepID=A0ABY7NMZ2_9SPHN|nr:N-acetylglucosamine-specific PTS transporter subunit IIBC [Sphingomonas abietis]WBO21856.1 N-acetylglucosamine-specific PTS transporter subunit IIBC [Sphingomonas abietis]